MQVDEKDFVFSGFVDAPTYTIVDKATRVVIEISTLMFPLDTPIRTSTFKSHHKLVANPHCSRIHRLKLCTKPHQEIDIQVPIIPVINSELSIKPQERQSIITLAVIIETQVQSKFSTLPHCGSRSTGCTSQLAIQHNIQRFQGKQALGLGEWGSQQHSHAIDLRTKTFT